MTVRRLATYFAAVCAIVAAFALASSSPALAGGGKDLDGDGFADVSAGTTSSDAAHNDADVMFVQHMIPHHQQAVEMSDIILAKQGIDPRVVQLASQIRGAQAPEIAQMQGWLNQWGNPPLLPNPHGSHGILSDQEIAALTNAQGLEASNLFLQQMITHHEGAVASSQVEIGDGQYPPAISLAGDIVSSQTQEIALMRSYLASPGQPAAAAPAAPPAAAPVPPAAPSGDPHAGHH